MKHTPGPWVALESNEVQIGTQRFIGCTNENYDIGRANARLIAAAPDYSAAADKAVLAIITVKNFLLNLADMPGINDERRKEVYRQIDDADQALIDAIVKATGKTQ